MLEIGAPVDRYVVEALLGRGGMACVWKVRDGAKGGVLAFRASGTVKVQEAVLGGTGANGRLQGSNLAGGGSSFGGSGSAAPGPKTTPAANTLGVVNATGAKDDAGGEHFGGGERHRGQRRRQRRTLWGW